jgi:RNA polymerase sigma factor
MVLEQEKQDEEDNPMESYALISASVDQYHLKQERERRQEEILVYKDKLKKYDITFNELVEQCPKHQDARENARQIAKLLASTPKLKQFLIEKKQLPIKDLLNCVRCGRKTIERNRKYIIAMALISIYQLDSLRSYIEPEQALSGKEDIQDEKRHRRRNSTP